MTTKPAVHDISSRRRNLEGQERARFGEGRNCRTGGADPRCGRGDTGSEQPQQVQNPGGLTKVRGGNSDMSVSSLPAVRQDRFPSFAGKNIRPGRV
jgi:hypothetical protein